MKLRKVGLSFQNTSRDRNQFTILKPQTKITEASILTGVSVLIVNCLVNLLATI